MKLFVTWAAAALFALAAVLDYCHISGLRLADHAATAHEVHLSGNETRRYASLENLARDKEAIDGKIQKIRTVDYLSGKKIDAQSAVYVLASDLKSDLTRYPKAAFETEKAADAFIARHGGDKRTFGFALTVAERDAAADDKAQAPARSKAHERGQKLHDRVCQNAPDPMQFNTIAELKTALETPCAKLSEPHRHDLALYLWEKKRFNLPAGAKSDRLAVPENAKCPVCGMFVAKYPKWAAKQSFADGTEYYFDGAKDFFKYYFAPARYGGTHGKPVTLIVTDYYTLKAIDATGAWYVLGSDVYGPMGHELIPFENEADAQAFMRDHRGKQRLRFGEVTQEAVWALDR